MSDNEIKTTPTRPYMARAIYEWICDNNLTPYLLVDAKQPHTQVPMEFVQDGQIVLNTAPHAVKGFVMSNDLIQFSARFGGVSRDIFIPYYALLGIYARENGQGLFFDPNEYDDIQIETDEVESKSEQTEAPKKKPSLRLLD